jgi:hypothetical protein
MVFCDVGVEAQSKSVLSVLSFGASSVRTWILPAPTRTRPQDP